MLILVQICEFCYLFLAERIISVYSALIRHHEDPAFWIGKPLTTKVQLLIRIIGVYYFIMHSHF